MQHLTRFIKDEEGVTAIEYGLIAALVILVCILAITSAGTSLNALWNRISSALSTAGGS